MILKVYETADGGYICGKLPAYLNGTHYGPPLIRFILYQHYHCRVTQPILLEQLREMGVEISAGKLTNILVEEKDLFHQEKDNSLSVGLQISSYANVDDTGARHKGKNGYCTHIGNESFSWFESTSSKSRINFLMLLRAGRTDYWITSEEVAYGSITCFFQPSGIKQLQMTLAKTQSSQRKCTHPMTIILWTIRHRINYGE